MHLIAHRIPKNGRISFMIPITTVFMQLAAIPVTVFMALQLEAQRNRRQRKMKDSAMAEPGNSYKSVVEGLRNCLCFFAKWYRDCGPVIDWWNLTGRFDSFFSEYCLFIAWNP